MPTVSQPVCQISWMENGELITDGRPAVILAHLYYRQDFAHPSAAPSVLMCQEHYDLFSSREFTYNPQFASPERTRNLSGLGTYFDDFHQGLHVTYSALPIQVTVSPGSFTLAPNQTQQFTATVTGTPNTAVTWTAAQGSITSTGFYTAPNTTLATVDTITAQSVVNRCALATVQVSIAALVTITVVVSPAGITINFGQTQQFTAVVTGISSQAVTWSLAPGAVGTISAGGLYTAPAILPAKAVDTVVATSVASPVTTGQRSITINPGGVPVVLITPPGVTIQAGQTQQFSASVTNIANQAVTWSIESPALGTIDQTGLYTSPATVSSTQVDNILAISVGYPAAGSAASITIVPTPVPLVTINPQFPNAVAAGGTSQFTATVTGATNTAVTWSLGPNVPGGLVIGTISSTGLYTAPTTVAANTYINIIATSQANTAASTFVSQQVLAGGPLPLDLVRWIMMSTRTTNHLVGDANAPYSTQIIDTDPLYPSNYPAGCVWQIKNKLGHPWDVHPYDANYIYHWITEDGDAVDQPACQAANGTSCWMYSHAYKRYLDPVAVMPRNFTSGTTITIDTPGPNTNYATTNCETTAPRVITIGDVRGITTGLFKISWGGSIDAGAGTGPTAPNYDNVNGVNTIKVQYCYTGTIASGNFTDIEEYYYVLGFGQVGWYYYHGGVFQNKTVNNTLASTGCPAPSFPCGPGNSWFTVPG